MERIMFLMLFVVLPIIPMVSYAETGQECASDCVETCSVGGTNKDDNLYKNCLSNCLKGCMDKDTGIPEVPPPTPADPSKTKSDTEVQKAFTFCSSENYQEITTGTFLLALGEKLCCYDKGRLIGRCHELTPYFNVLNGECYETREACKESAGGYDFCFICGSKC